MYYWRSPPQRQPSAGSAGLTDRLYQVQASLPPGALTSLVSEDEIGRTGKLFPPPTIFLRNASGMERSQRRGSRAGPSLILCTQIHLLVLGHENHCDQDGFRMFTTAHNAFRGRCCRMVMFVGRLGAGFPPARTSLEHSDHTWSPHDPVRMGNVLHGSS
jgi:hypothetical protein